MKHPGGIAYRMHSRRDGVTIDNKVIFFAKID
jgi:hypothetical protein